MSKPSSFISALVFMASGLGWAIAFTISMPMSTRSQEASTSSRRAFETQCLHTERGLEPCTVVENSQKTQFDIRWQDGSEYHVRFANRTVEFRDAEHQNWQEVQQAGLCWAWRCFKTDIEPLNTIEKTKAAIDAICLDVSGHRSNCTVQDSAEFNGGIISWSGEGQASASRDRQERFKFLSSGLFYTFETSPTRWIGPVKAGLCADEICVFDILESPNASDSEAPKSKAE